MSRLIRPLDVTKPPSMRAVVAWCATVVIAFGLAFTLGMPHPASASNSNQPPTTSVPGPYYDQGDLINLCVNTTTEAVRVEEHSDVLGNCAAGEVQLTVEAMPSPPTEYTASAPVPNP